MGLDLMPDPETFANPPRDLQNQNQRAKYLYDSNLPEDWGSTASESGDDDADNLNDDEELAQYMLETGGLTDREVDRLDGKTSNRLGVRDSTAAGGMGASGPNGTKNYPERETGANTGPKGVLADQKYHQQQQLQERLSNQQAYNARMLAKAPTTTTFREDQARERREKKAQGLLDKDDEADAKKEDAEDAEEKAILDRIRINRLKDMSWAAQKNAAGGPGGAGGKKVFGSLMEMNAAQYVSAIDSEKKDVTVVIHIYSEVRKALSLTKFILLLKMWCSTLWFAQMCDKPAFCIVFINVLFMLFLLRCNGLNALDYRTMPYTYTSGQSKTK